MLVKKNTKPDCCRKNPSNERELKDLGNFLKVISDKNRLRIICSLADSRRCVCEIYEQLDLSQNLTSHHLKFLEKAKLVSCKKVGVKVFYKLNAKELEKNRKLLSKFLKF